MLCYVIVAVFLNDPLFCSNNIHALNGKKEGIYYGRD